MGNKYPQTNEAKEKFESPLLAYIQTTFSNNPEHVFTREELVETTGMSDRSVRREMEKIANYYPIISVSDRTGYVYGSFDDNTPLEKINTLFDDVNHALNELQCRIDSLSARMKPLIGLKMELLKKIINTALSDVKI